MEIVSFGGMMYTNKIKDGEISSSFLIKKIEVTIPVLHVDVSMKVIKTRDIRLLEWGIIAPLNELNDPTPSLEEISKEFGVEKIEFFKHVANELTTLGVLEQKSDVDFDITEMGKKLYKMGKMVSDPRDVNFPMYYESQSKEWLIGAQNIDSSKNYDEETPPQSINDVPDYIPDELIDQHIKLINALEDDENRIEHELLNTSDIDITVHANILLTKEGINIRVTKQPFGNRHQNFVSQILRRKLIDEKELKHHLKEYVESVAGYGGIQTVQSHRLPIGAKLISPLEISRIVDEHLMSKPKWIIVNNHETLKIIINKTTRPEIIICLNDENNSLEITSNHDTSYTIVPASVELVIPNSKNLIPSGSVYSENKISTINFIEANDYQIPLFVVQLNENPGYAKSLLDSLINENNDTATNLNLKVASFYLNPTEELFNEVIDNISAIGIQDHDLAKKGLQEIIDFKSRMKSCNLTNESAAVVYNKILKYLMWNDMIDFNLDIIVHCRTLYSNKLNELLDSFLVKSEKRSWINIHNNIEKLAKYSHDLHILQSKMIESGYYSQYDVLSNVIVESIQKCKQFVEMQIEQLPNPSTINEILDLFRTIDQSFNDGELNAYYVKQIQSLVNIETTSLNPEDLLEIQLYFSQKGFIPENGGLEAIFHKIYGNIEIDLSDLKKVRKLIEIYNKFKNIKPDFYMKNSIYDYLPNQVKKCENKEQIQHLITNLAELSKNKIIDNRYLQKIIRIQSNILSESNNFDDLQKWLFLLLSVKRLIESPQKTKVLEISTDKIWNTIYPLIDKDPNKIKKIQKDLNALGLSDKLKKIEKETDIKTINAIETNKTGADKNTRKKTKIINKSPISKIIVDGSNVARAGLKDSQGSAKQLINVYKSLKEDYEFNEIAIIIGAGLRHHTPDFEKLEPYIENDIVRQAPAGTSDDFYIIQFAIDNDMLILTNDMYREFKEKYPELKTDIEMRRITFMVNPDNESVTLGQFPEYKKEE